MGRRRETASFPLRRRLAPCALAAAFLLAGASAAAADVLVVRSSGPSAKLYPLGKRLRDKDRIVLQARDELTLLDAGGTRDVRGPGIFAAWSAASTPAQLSAASAASRGRRAAIGAVRGAPIEEEPPRPPDLWSADAEKNATLCVSPRDGLSLWRAHSAAAATLDVAGRGGIRSLDWPAGMATLRWPKDLPIADGMRYDLSGIGPGVARLRFRTMPRRPQGLLAIASMLIARGCAAQLDLLIETSRPPD